MILTVNLGNSNISFGVFEGTQCKRFGRVKVEDLQLLPDHIGAERFNQIALASVVPSRADQLISILAMNYNVPVLLAGRDLEYGIEIQCDEPDKVGADRLLNAVAAYARTGTATIVADIGTAITADLVSVRGSFCGGAIAPGPDAMLRALHDYTAILPEVALQEPPSPLGRNTTDAMRSGVYWGTVGLVEALISRLSAEQTGAVSVITTGGHGEFVTKQMKRPAEFVPTLTLEGLAILALRTE